MSTVKRITVKNGNTWEIGSNAGSMDGGSVIVTEGQIDGMTNAEIGSYVRQLMTQARLLNVAELAEWIFTKTEKQLLGEDWSELVSLNTRLKEFNGYHPRISKAFSITEGIIDAKSKYTKRRREATSNRDTIVMLLRERDGDTCACCGATGNLEVDHIKPVSMGGGNELENLQFLCKSCNASKGVQTIDYRG